MMKTDFKPRPEVTIITEADGRKFGVMRWCGLEVKEEIDPITFEYTRERQKYWMRRILVLLERKLKVLSEKYPFGANA